MESGKFILCGNDRKTLSGIKNALTANGHQFIGYTGEFSSVLRHVRKCLPNLIIVDVGTQFQLVKGFLEVIDEENIAAVILILDVRSDEISEFVTNSKMVYCMTKPVFAEALLQILHMALLSYSRVFRYESRIRELNEELENRKVVEKAKWLLVEKEGCSEADAHDMIRKKSRDNRLPMRKVAEAIILSLS